MREVRPYQAQAIRNVLEAWTVYRSTLLVLATGAGKSYTAARILAERASHGRILWLAHRRELITQARDAIEAEGLNCEIEMAQDWARLSECVDLFGEGSACVVASIASLQGARLRRFKRDAFATIVIDEAHHATAKGYRDVLAQFPDARVLGLTATPDRGDGVGLKGVFESVAFEYGIREAIVDGWLAPIVQKAIECADLDLSDVKTVGGDLAQGELERVMNADAVLHQIAGPLVEHAGNRPTIIFTASVDNAHSLVGVLASYTQARAAAIDGTTPPELRARILTDFAERRIQFLANCAVLTEGFDAPITSCIAMARPTKARALYTQCVGRGTRLSPGKTDCLVLDFVGNSGRHKLVNPLDILDGRSIPPDVRKAAEEKARGGMPSESALAEAEREAIERAEREERERVRRAKAKADVAHRAMLVDPFGVVDVGERSRGPGATPRQSQALTNMGVSPEQVRAMSVGDASRMLDALAERRKKNLCTYKQAAQLSKRGLSPDLTFPEARAALDALSSNRWQVTADMRARWGRSEAAE